MSHTNNNRQQPGAGAGTGSGLKHLSNPFGDTTYTRIFVGGLAWETQSETIRRHFGQYGEILEAVVITDKISARSKGYGFVTFRDPESATKACADPNPIIDGRKANCNLASLGRPQQYFPYGCIPAQIPYFGMPQMPRGIYIGSPSFQQPSPTNYQPGFVYPSYGYTAYGPDFAYPQGVYNPYMRPHYLSMYGPSGPINTSINPYGQMGAPLRGTTIQGFAAPNVHVPQYAGHSVGLLTTDTTAAIQTPYGTGQPRMFVPGPPPQFAWRSADQIIC